MGRVKIAKPKTPFVPRCTELAWVLGWRFVKSLIDDRRLLALPANRMGQRMADQVGQIVDRSKMPEAALFSASWHIAITEYRYHVVPQQLISVRKFWLFEEFVIRPWGPAGAPTREEVRSGLTVNPIYFDPDVVSALYAFRPRGVSSPEGPTS